MPSFTVPLSPRCQQIGMCEGFDYNVCLGTVFAVIVMYDASGVRGQKNNKGPQSDIEDLNRRELHPERLRELLGHTPFEVLVGAALGIVVALWRL